MVNHTKFLIVGLIFVIGVIIIFSPLFGEYGVLPLALIVYVIGGLFGMLISSLLRLGLLKGLFVVVISEILYLSYLYTSVGKTFPHDLLYIKIFTPGIAAGLFLLSLTLICQSKQINSFNYLEYIIVVILTIIALLPLKPFKPDSLFNMINELPFNITTIGICAGIWQLVIILAIKRKLK